MATTESRSRDPQLSEIGRQLDTLTRLAALMLVQGRETLSDRVEVLNRAGLPPKMIAQFCGTTPNTVSVLLSRQRAVTRRVASGRSPNRELPSQSQSGP